MRTSLAGSRPVEVYIQRINATTSKGRRKRRRRRRRRRRGRESRESFHAKWRFRSDGIALNLRIPYSLERDGERGNRSRGVGREENKSCIRSGTVDKCTSIPSYRIPSNYPPRSTDQRDKARPEREREIARTEAERGKGKLEMLERNYLTRSCNIYIEQRDESRADRHTEKKIARVVDDARWKAETKKKKREREWRHDSSNRWKERARWGIRSKPVRLGTSDERH